MKKIIDNFSTGAAGYAIFRPESPAAIFDFLYQHVHSFGAAWDCGTGNGQVAVKLADRFTQVYGTDISGEQLARANKKDNVTYLEERAEQTSLPGNSIDLITVGQAIHWFDFDAFYKEVRRVAKPGALIAAWTYNLLEVTPSVDKVIRHLYHDITWPYWDKERAYVDAAYRTIPFPFEEIPCPVFEIVGSYTLEQLIGYLGTWSGVRHYIEKQQEDPVALIANDLKAAWGNTEKLQVRWPVHIRAGKVG